MLIRSRQLDTFRQHRLLQFENDMLEHIREHFTGHFRALSEAQLRSVIRLAHSRAGTYGLDTVRSVCIYLNCTLWLGSRFDTDPQYPWAQAILSDRRTAHQRDRASRLSDASTAYMLRVAGADNIHYSTLITQLLRELPAQPDYFLQLAAGNPRDFLARLFPSKWADLPEELRNGLFPMARRLASRYGLGDERGTVLYATLMYLLGSGFDKDPQFPWASAILEDASTGPEQKTEALIRSGLEQLRKAENF